jgi:integrase
MGKLLVRQWNTYFAEMRVPKALQHLFVHGEDKPAHLRGKPVVKFTKSLETDSHELAEIRKLPIIANWKAMIAAARQTVSPKQFDYDKAVKSYSETFKALGGGDDAAGHLAHQLNPMTASTAEEQEQRRVVFGVSTGKGLATSLYLDEWMGQCEYNPKGKDEAGRFIKSEFCKRFPVFELTDRKELKIWVEDQLKGRNGFKAAARPTVRKRLGWVNSFWDYVESQYTEIECMTRNILPKPKKTKSSAVQNSYHPFTVEEYFMLVDATEKSNRGRGDPELKDLIIVGAHTGCRLGELTHMKLDCVGDDWFQVEDSKTANGIRRIPIHTGIQQLVERLKQTSQAANSEYLFSGLSDNNQYKNRSNGVGKRFGKLKDDLGFRGKNYGYHSFRSTLLNLFESAGVAENFAARIIGHKVESMTYGLYSEDIPWIDKVNTVAQIEYVIRKNR